MKTNDNMKRNARVDVADVLRGLAVMGIILLHSIEHFNFYAFPDTSEQSVWLNFTDRAVWDGLFFMFGGKAYAVFALLFGFSFFIQDDNQRMRGHDFRGRFCWRLILLFLIGNINAMFFTGEILVLYSLVGFVLVATCRLSDRWLMALSAIFLLQPLHIVEIVRLLFDADYNGMASLQGNLWSITSHAQRSGTFLETVKVNLWEGQLVSLAWAWENGRVFQTAALFMMGLLIGRRGWFMNTPSNQTLWGRVLAVALIAFFPLYGLNNMLGRFIADRAMLTAVLLIVSSLMKFAFMLILVCGVLFAYYNTRLQKTLHRIIPYGKMSLTNYLTQSIVGSFLFYHWGLALYDDLTITFSFLVGILLFVLQFAFCRWWLSRHNHGPFEYLWKRATWIGRR